jgi:hypothetical protein
MTIKGLRILPPFAIGRLGSAAEPLDNYTIDTIDDDSAADPKHPLGFRRIKGTRTLVVDEASGEIREARDGSTPDFKQDGAIRPVAPFLELFALTEDDVLEPLTQDLLGGNGSDTKICWRVVVANRKVFRRTGDDNDIVQADTRWFCDHAPRRLEGHCNNFVRDTDFIDFGHVRFIKPSEEFPEIRLRFTPAKGLIYGPNKTADDKPDRMIREDRAIYDVDKGGWRDFGDPDAPQSDAFRNETLPPSLYAIRSPAPPWLHNNVAVSRGYLDDACDGFVEVKLTVGGAEFAATARICAAPPVVVPDSLFVRSLADDLDQVVHGPIVPRTESDAVTHKRAEDIVRRAYETVRFMNVAVMNGNSFKGRQSLLLDSMPEEEAANTQRAIRPVMPPGTVDTLAILTLHEQVFAALRGRAAPWFLRLLRQPEEVADFTDRGRRKMPALMCGADNNYLALTRRQIDTIRKAGEQSLFDPPAATPSSSPPASLTPRNLSAQLHYRAAGNPISSMPVTAVANCCPGLEVDFRAAWRRLFKGLVLREYDSLVVELDKDWDWRQKNLKGHRLLRIHTPDDRIIRVVTQFKGPTPSDVGGEMILTTDLNPAGLAPLEWSNALAPILEFKGQRLRCEFTREEAWELGDLQDPFDGPISVELEVRSFFEDDTAVISKVLADAGELTQGLCSPWQNDYRECSCYYWASARPDYVNVEPTPAGLSKGDNWLQKKRTLDYVPDDYVDTRLIRYDDLFENWEDCLKIQIGGRDMLEAASSAKKDAAKKEDS